jgi:hypothetical protein
MGSLMKWINAFYDLLLVASVVIVLYIILGSIYLYLGGSL